MTSGRVLLAGLTDEDVRERLKKMDRKPLTKATLTSLSDLMEAVRQIRTAGYATIDGELEPGLLSIAVPIKDRRGETVASLNVSSSATRTTLPEFCARALPVMRATAMEIGKILP